LRLNGHGPNPADILVGGELKIHLIGVAGSGMSGIAGLLIRSAITSAGRTRRGRSRSIAEKLGLRFYLGQAAANVAEADLIIFSSAIRPGNAEYDEALRTNRNMVRRADALAAIMNCKKGIVICGMHARRPRRR